MAVFAASLLLASLFLCGRVASQASTTDLLREAARKSLCTPGRAHTGNTSCFLSTSLLLSHVAVSQGPLTCDNWDCECTFNRQRGCCCGANDMYQLEEKTFTRMTHLWHGVSELGDRAHSLASKETDEAERWLDVMPPHHHSHPCGPIRGLLGA